MHTKNPWVCVLDPPIVINFVKFYFRPIFIRFYALRGPSTLPLIFFQPSETTFKKPTFGFHGGKTFSIYCRVMFLDKINHFISLDFSFVFWGNSFKKNYQEKILQDYEDIRIVASTASKLEEPPRENIL